jgi:uncharacterized protein (TIGR03086 family)
MDVLELHRRAVEAWQARVDAIDADAWDNPTPCSDWTVRDLVNHVVYEELWMVPLLEGKTIADVGDQFDGDVLGDDPLASARSASAAALASADELLPDNPTVHLSYADEKAHEYATQIAADHVIHGWDLAKGAGQDPTIDPEIVAFLAEWFPHHEDLYRSVGIIGERGELTGDPQTDLLARFGRRADWVSG